MKKNSKIKKNLSLSIGSIIISLFLFYGCVQKRYVNSSLKPNKNYMILYVAGFFDKDTLSMLFNEVTMMNGVVVTSTLNTSETGYTFYVSKEKRMYKCIYREGWVLELSSVTLPLRNGISITTILNGEKQNFEFNAKKGKYLFLDKMEDSIYFHQFSKDPEIY